MNAIRIDSTFARDYEVDVISELPKADAPRVIRFCSTESGSVQDGLIVRVSPHNAQTWIGVFPLGGFSSRGLTAVFAHPDAGRLCVFANVAGLTNVRDDVLTKLMVLEYVRPFEFRELFDFSNETTRFFTLGPMLLCSPS